MCVHSVGSYSTPRQPFPVERLRSCNKSSWQAHSRTDLVNEYELLPSRHYWRIILKQMCDFSIARRVFKWHWVIKSQGCDDFRTIVLKNKLFKLLENFESSSRAFKTKYQQNFSEIFSQQTHLIGFELTTSNSLIYLNSLLLQTPTVEA